MCTEGGADLLLRGSARHVDLVAEDEERDILEVLATEEILERKIYINISKSTLEAKHNPN